ncbi:hypothetical protein [Roseimaritima sediminicola]|uniref:hypothetical protein n=1 Tax=Roseimaritima sediminicola TaxID=2662066 RepID=UPI0013870222|nr:hypothetical protein [Roseimaritima sediminicola]
MESIDKSCVLQSLLDAVVLMLQKAGHHIVVETWRQGVGDPLWTSRFPVVAVSGLWG